jgi:hypothetical protein
VKGGSNDINAQLKFCSASEENISTCAKLTAQGSTIPIAFLRNTTGYYLNSGTCSYRYTVSCDLLVHRAAAGGQAEVRLATFLCMPPLQRTVGPENYMLAGAATTAATTATATTNTTATPTRNSAVASMASALLAAVLLLLVTLL